MPSVRTDRSGNAIIEGVVQQAVGTKRYGGGLMQFGTTINADSTINLANAENYHGKITPVTGNRTLTFSNDLPDGFSATFEGQAPIVAGAGLTLQNADTHTKIKANGVATVYLRGTTLVLVGQTEA
jgi:hypothetical protein